jgi:hypothetical protein
MALLLPPVDGRRVLRAAGVVQKDLVAEVTQKQIT